MTRYLALVVALSACAPQSDRADSAGAALPAIDTLKPVIATDSAESESESKVVTPTPTPTPKLGRDSAFPPPRGLPKLDTVPTKRPPR